MKVIITGGTGMIGRALTRRLLAKHHDVIVLTRNPDKYRNKVLNGVQLVKWDSETGNGWFDLITDNTAIINLAAASIAGERLFPPQRWTEARKNLIRDSRVDAGAAIVDAVKRADALPKVVIQQSGTNHYGVDNGDEKITEEHPPGDDFLAGVTIAWENSTAPLDEMGIRRLITRSGIVLSMRGGALPPLVFPFRFFVGGPIGSGDQWYSWIHIDDEADAMIHLMEHETATGAFNLTSPTPVPQHYMAKAIGKAMGRPSFFQMPAAFFKLGFGELATTVLDGHRVIPQRLLEMGYKFQFDNIEAAVDDLINHDGIRA